MSGNSLVTSAALQCPHGGQVQITSTNTRVKAGGTPLATADDVYVVSGCPFQLPGPTPSPCVEVRWLVPDARAKVDGHLTLSQSSSGMCFSAAKVPQGPVSVIQTQTGVSTS